MWKLIRPLIFYLCFVWFFYRVQGILLGVSHSCCEPWLWAFRFIFLIGKSYVVYGIYVGFGPIKLEVCLLVKVVVSPLAKS